MLCLGGKETQSEIEHLSWMLIGLMLHHIVLGSSLGITIFGHDELFNFRQMVFCGLIRCKRLRLFDKAKKK